MSGRLTRRPSNVFVMTGDAPESPSIDDGARLVERHEDLVWWATWIGLFLAGVGLIDGVIMASKKKMATCPDGTYFPEGTTDFNCYVHPQAGLGVAIAAVSVLLGILVVFGGISARAGLRA